VDPEPRFVPEDDPEVPVGFVVPPAPDVLVVGTLSSSACRADWSEDVFCSALRACVIASRQADPGPVEPDPPGALDELDPLGDAELEGVAEGLAELVVLELAQAVPADDRAWAAAARSAWTFALACLICCCS